MITETVDAVLADAGIDPAHLTWTQQQIIRECLRLMRTLLTRGLKYGDSFLHPAQVFSRVTPLEFLDMQIDQKLARIKDGVRDEEHMADTVHDTAGYSTLRPILVAYLALSPTEREAASPSSPTAVMP